MSPERRDLDNISKTGGLGHESDEAWLREFDRAGGPYEGRLNTVSAVVACWHCRGEGRVHEHMGNERSGAPILRPERCGHCNATGLVRIVAPAERVPTIRRDA